MTGCVAGRPYHVQPTHHFVQHVTVMKDACYRRWLEDGAPRPKQPEEERQLVARWPRNRSLVLNNCPLSLGYVHRRARLRLKLAQPADVVGVRVRYQDTFDIFRLVAQRCDL